MAQEQKQPSFQPAPAKGNLFDRVVPAKGDVFDRAPLDRLDITPRKG